MRRIRYRRRSARVILADRAGRILLFGHQSSADPDGVCTWITPGGGMRHWESPHRAAARELREETGLRVPARRLRPMVAFSSGHADRSWATGLFRDDFFFHRVDTHTVDTTGFTDHERAAMSRYHWWTLQELATTEELVLPLGLRDLAGRLLDGWRPTEPERLPWYR